MADIVNNREIAVVFWTVILFAWVLSYREVRSSLKEVVRVFFAKQIVISMLLFITYVLAVVFLLYKIGIWYPSNLKTTVFWVIGTAFTMLMTINDVKKNEHYFRKVVLDNLKLLLVLEFILGLYVFNLWMELILVPILAITVILKDFTESKPEYKSVATLLNVVMVMFGTGLLTFSIYSLVYDLQGFATADNLREFILPPVLTLSFLPFIYVMALYIAYENIHMRMRFFCKERKLVWHAMWRVFNKFHFNLNNLNRWSSTVGILKITNQSDISRLLI